MTTEIRKPTVTVEWDAENDSYHITCLNGGTPMVLFIQELQDLQTEIARVMKELE